MPLSRTTIALHGDLHAEVTYDAEHAIGEVIISGRSYGFTWADGHGVQWDKEMPYVQVSGRIAELIGQ